MKAYGITGGIGMDRYIWIVAGALMGLLLLALGVLNARASESVGGGEIMFTEPVKSVIFSHAYHVETLKLGCEACHSGTFEMAALTAQKKGDFTMESLSKGKYCGSCHNGSMAFSSETHCAICHAGVKGYDAMNSQKASAEGGEHH